MFVTIATPAYNRASLLPRLYESLCRQTCTDFEWLVVDDGSRDDTESLIDSFIEDGHINIRYIKKTNGGKHTAVNLAAKQAKGELFFIADSDDWLPADAISNVFEVYKSINGDEAFAGICGLDQYADGQIIGGGLPCNIIDASPQDIRGKWGIKGDLKEIFRTKVIRQYPFPEIPGEKFCPEALVWNRIGLRYKLRYFNKPIYIVEYQTDGLTRGITHARMNSPVSTMMTYSEWFNMENSVKAKMRMAINFWRFAFCASGHSKVKISGWGKMLLPVGICFHFMDLISYKNLKIR